MIFDKPTSQDMMTLEFGLFIYKIAGFSTPLDEITVMPLMATLRYNLMFTEHLGAFLYGGIIKNNVSTDGAVANINLLATTKFAGGVGLLIGIGPGWALRGDVGLDMFAVGAALKF